MAAGLQSVHRIASSSRHPANSSRHWQQFLPITHNNHLCASAAIAGALSLVGTASNALIFRIFSSNYSEPLSHLRVRNGFSRPQFYLQRKSN